MTQTARDFAIGDTVEVHAMGHWYTGTVVKIGRTCVTVSYTSGTGRTRDKAVNPSVDYTEKNWGPDSGPGVRRIGAGR